MIIIIIIIVIIKIIIIIIKINQNTENNPRDFRGLAVTQTPVKNHQLTLVWKAFKGVNNNNKAVLGTVPKRLGKKPRKTGE